MRTSWTRLVAGAFLLPCLAAAGGCDLQQRLLGASGEYLLTGFDVLALPGEEVPVRVRLQEGSFLRDKPGVVVQFSANGQPIRSVLTDDEGYAAISLRPPAPGDYAITATVSPAGLPEAPPPPTVVRVACREAGAALLIVDLDKTLVASGFRTVLAGDPVPMPGSVDAMNRLAREFTVVYLTHRIDYLGAKSKAWLEAHGYPRGPLLLADVHGFLERSGTFKSELLTQIRRRFYGRAVGIGDKISDAKAYGANGVEAVLILHVDPEADSRDLRRLADWLEEAPDSAQAATDWGQVERAVTKQAAYPRRPAQAELRRRADELESRSKSTAQR